VALRCMTDTPDWVPMPPRNVVPKPHQKPHPRSGCIPIGDAVLTTFMCAPTKELAIQRERWRPTSSVVLSPTTTSSESIDLGSPTYGASSSLGALNTATTLKRSTGRPPGPIGLAHGLSRWCQRLAWRRWNTSSARTTFDATRSSASIK
jgi:hypothetical protein